MFSASATALRLTGVSPPWSPSWISSRTPYSALVVKIIAGKAYQRGRSWPRGVGSRCAGRRAARDAYPQGDPGMAYDEDLANLIRECLAGEAGVVEQRMFGGLAFLIGGNMAVAASGQGGLMVRVDPGQTEALLAEPHAQPFEMRGREMAGWLRVDAEGVQTREDLEPWVRRGVAYAGSLPAKGS